MQHGKKYNNALSKIEKGKSYSISEAIKIIKENKSAKFDESFEVHIKLAVDPEKGEEQTRGSAVLPHGTGKTKRVAVITSTRAKEAKKAGADIVGGEEMIEKFSAKGGSAIGGKGGKFDFDVLVATPEMMPKLAPVAKILGPRGLMPSPKTETVTEKVKETVEVLKKGKINFKNDATSNIHQIIGKVSFDDQKLNENFKSFIEAIKKAKPEAVKGKFIISVSVCSTMSPGIRIAV